MINLRENILKKYYCMLHKEYLAALKPKCLNQESGKRKGKKCKYMIIIKEGEINDRKN